MAYLSKNNARKLAVSYQAYLAAVYANDWNGIATWGDILLIAQDRTGIELQKPELIRSFIERAGRMLVELADAAEAQATLDALEPSDTDGDTSRWNENGESSERENDRYASRNYRD